MSTEKEFNRILTQLDSIKNIVNCRNKSEEQAFDESIIELGKATGIEDAIFVRLHNDETSEVITRIDKSKQLLLNDREADIAATLRSNPEHKISLAIEEEQKTLIAFPLTHKTKLLGILFIAYENEKIIDFKVCEFCVRLIRDQLSLFVLSEEKEIWESFYQSNLSA